MLAPDRNISIYVDNWKNLFPKKSKIRHKLEDLLVELFFLFDGTFWANERKKSSDFVDLNPLIKDILSLQYHSHSRLETDEIPIREEEVDSILDHLKENYHTSYSSDPVIRKFILSRMEKMVHYSKERTLDIDFSTTPILLEKPVKMDKRKFQREYPIEMDKYAELYIPETEKDSYNFYVCDLKSFGLTIYEDKNNPERNFVSLGYFFQPHPYNLNLPNNTFEVSFLDNLLRKDPLRKKNPVETFFILVSELFSSSWFYAEKNEEIKSEISFFRSALSYLFYVIKEDRISHLDIQVDRKKKSITVQPYIFLN